MIEEIFSVLGICGSTKPKDRAADFDRPFGCRPSEMRNSNPAFIERGMQAQKEATKEFWDNFYDHGNGD